MKSKMIKRGEERTCDRKVRFVKTDIVEGIRFLWERLWKSLIKIGKENKENREKRER